MDDDRTLRASAAILKAEVCPVSIVAVARQDQISIDRDNNGGLILRQRNALGDDDDVIAVAADNVPRLIDAIAAIAMPEAMASQARRDPRHRTDRTNAERQRRYRARQRNGVTRAHGGVTAAND